MSFDITPLVPSGRQLIQGYGNGGFTIAGVRYEGAVLVLPEQTHAWSVEQTADATMDSLRQIAESEPPTEILLFGGGATTPFLAPDLRAALKSAGIVAEPMDTGAACRTFNVLLAEERRVAAALLAVF